MNLHETEKARLEYLKTLESGSNIKAKNQSTCEFKIDNYYHPPTESFGLEIVDLTRTLFTVRRNRKIATYNLTLEALMLEEKGDVVETGVYLGGSSIIIASAMEAFDTCNRKFWAADSFEGLIFSIPQYHHNQNLYLTIQCSTSFM